MPIPTVQTWPVELMREIHNHTSAEHWQFEFFSDSGGASWLSGPLSKHFPEEQVLVHLMLAVLDKFTHCPRCHDWVFTIGEMNPVHNICTTCVNDIKAGHPLKKHGEDQQPKETAEWFYQTLLGSAYEERLRELPLVASELEVKEKWPTNFEQEPKSKTKKAKRTSKQNQSMNTEQAATVAATFLEVAPLFANLS